MPSRAGAATLGTEPHWAPLPCMEKNALKLLGAKLRHQLPTQETKGSKELRRLIVQLERRERERDRQRDEATERKPH
jgi:hypothetical protein